MEVGGAAECAEDEFIIRTYLRVCVSKRRGGLWERFRLLRKRRLWFLYARQGAVRPRLAPKFIYSAPVLAASGSIKAREQSVFNNNNDNMH